LAGTASDRVRAIIEAAESSAAEIRAEAEAEAERIRAQAEERASAVRSEVRGDVQALMGSIREAVDRLSSDLERLEERLGDPEPQPVSSPAPVTPVEPDEDPDIALAEDAAVGRDEDIEGARLVALNMALDGASRDEVDRHLRDKHGVKDPAPLLDEVFSSIG
jgi:hypothetical protein